MTVLAGSEDEARSRALHRIDEPERYHIKRRWPEDGEQVEALDK
jgi:hypothetical protein